MMWRPKWNASVEKKTRTMGFAKGAASYKNRDRICEMAYSDGLARTLVAIIRVLGEGAGIDFRQRSLSSSLLPGIPVGCGRSSVERPKIGSHSPSSTALSIAVVKSAPSFS